MKASEVLSYMMLICQPRISVTFRIVTFMKNSESTDVSGAKNVKFDPPISDGNGAEAFHCAALVAGPALIIENEENAVSALTTFTLDVNTRMLANVSASISSEALLFSVFFFS
jgi:hypothetical protein